MISKNIFLETGQRIAVLRGKVSQAEFAGRLGVDRQTVGRWEAGERLPDGMSLLKFMKEFDADVNYILTGIDSAAHARLQALQTRISAGVDSGQDHATVVAAERVRTAAQRREADLLKQFQRADESGKKLIEGTAALAAKSSKKGSEK